MAVGDVVAKNEFSESANGVGIKIAAVATAGTLIHTAVGGAVNFDEIWIWAYNSHTAAVVLTIEMGGVSDPDHHIVKTIPVDDGLTLVVPGLILNGAATVRGFASIANVVVAWGYVHNLTA